jgi:hypothetical protein
MGRRASDRAQGQFRRRASDFQANEGGASSTPSHNDAAPPPKKLLLAAGLGAVLGMSLTAIVFLLFVKG